MYVHDRPWLALFVVPEQPEHVRLADLFRGWIRTRAVVKRAPVPYSRLHLFLRVDKPLLEVHFFELLAGLPVL